jgi:hypothetical protein
MIKEFADTSQNVGQTETRRQVLEAKGFPGIWHGSHCKRGLRATPPCAFGKPGNGIRPSIRVARFVLDPSQSPNGILLVRYIHPVPYLRLEDPYNSQVH